MMFEYQNASIKEITECPYPDCELCVHFTRAGCDVPIAVDKQNWLMLKAEIEKMKNDIKELDKALYDEILGVNRAHKEPLFETVTANGGEYGLPNDYDNEIHLIRVNENGERETYFSYNPNYRAGDSVEKDNTKINFKWENFE